MSNLIMLVTQIVLEDPLLLREIQKCSIKQSHVCYDDRKKIQTNIFNTRINFMAHANLYLDSRDFQKLYDEYCAYLQKTGNYFTRKYRNELIICYYDDAACSFDEFVLCFVDGFI